MGEVVTLAKDGEEQFIVYPYGWEKGIMVKGKWEGEYESLTVVKGGTVYRKGTCKNGKLNGKFRETTTCHAEDGLGEVTYVFDGKFIDSKKEGGFIKCENGKKYSIAWYEDNELVYEESVEA